MCGVKSSISFGWGKGRNVASAGWQVTLCDPVWHVSSRSGEASCELLYSVYLYLYPFLLDPLRTFLPPDYVLHIQRGEMSVPHYSATLSAHTVSLSLCLDPVH